MPKLYNKHHGDAPSTAVYIGRGSPYGNPFVLGTHGTRKEVIAKFEQRIIDSPDRDKLVKTIRKELKGKDMVCFCAPHPCHGDVLMRIANSKGEWPAAVEAADLREPIHIEQRNEHEYQMHNLPRNDIVWLQIENFDLLIKRTDEGIVVRLCDTDDMVSMTSLGTASAFDADTLSYKEPKA